jgi:predicted extracellular nuclease
MNKILLTALITLVMVFTVIGQEVVSIYDIQYTTDPSGDSPLLGSTVTVTGIVTAEHRGDVRANGGISGSYFHMQDASAPWSGIQVLYSGDYAAEGDSITVTGTVGEYFGNTEIIDVTSYILHSSQNEVPAPLEVTTVDADSAEAYEGCLVRVSDVTVTEVELDQYHEFRVSDGSGDVRIDTHAEFFYRAVLGDMLKSVTGVVMYSFNEYQILPRLAWDVVDGEFTRIQWFQQVRNSDLLRTFDDEISDTSYARRDTVTITGIVTMPTGLSYAGAGVKFIVSEPEGGPWSAVQSYDPDSTAISRLFEGDSIIQTGYVDEYQTAVSNMTELWNTSPVQIVGIGKDLPEPSFVNTGDLRLPESAEQWGTVMVYVKDATVTGNVFANELFEVDDGSGGVLVDDDSDSLQTFYDANPLPPVGQIADSIRGWVYHHYGAYIDSSAYKLEPLYMWDIKWGQGPPAIDKVKRDISAPTSSDVVTISADFATNLEIAEAALYYDVVVDGTPSGYTKVVMNNTTGDTYEGQIPAQMEGAYVNYYLVGTDTEDQSTNSPSNIKDKNYFYKVNNGEMAIKDVQETPWALADSPMEGYEVTLTGILTTDTTANNIFHAYSMQDEEDVWGGIFLFGISEILNEGDEVTVTGTITDYNADYHFKWDNNTMMLVDEVTINSSGNSVSALDVETAVLNGDTTSAEQYEGVLTRISNAELISINSYDVTFDDGSGQCLVDGDFMVDGDQYENSVFYINSDDDYLVAFGDTIRPGDIVDHIQGVFTYSFGTFKISVRNENDFGTVAGINPVHEAIPYTYQLKQNFPNPFNPETKIYFEIPQAQNVTMVIYNMLGQKVRTLVNDNYKAGQHVVNWDGTNDHGIRLSTGVYFYRIKAGDFIAAKKMLMLK